MAGFVQAHGAGAGGDDVISGGGARQLQPPSFCPSSLAWWSALVPVLCLRASFFQQCKTGRLRPSLCQSHRILSNGAVEQGHCCKRRARKKKTAFSGINDGGGQRVACAHGQKRKLDTEHCISGQGAVVLDPRKGPVSRDRGHWSWTPEKDPPHHTVGHAAGHTKPSADTPPIYTGP